MGIQLVEPLVRGGPHVPGHRREGRDDVGGGAAVGDRPVHLVGCVHRLAQRRDVDVRLDGGIERVEAELWSKCGVRFLAVELDVDMGDRQEARVDEVGRRGVDHHCGGGRFERPGVDEVDLAAVRLFGWGAQDRHPDAEVVDEGSTARPAPAAAVAMMLWPQA